MDQKKRVSIEGGWNAEFSSVVPGVWDQRQDWLQMARKVSRQGLEGMEEDSGRPRSSPKQLSEGQVCEMVKLKPGASTLGTAEDPEVIPSAPRAVAKREQF